MPADVYVQDGVVYPDEATAVVAMHPNIPPELKRVFITKPDEKPDTRDNNVYEPPATLDQNILTPRGLEGNRQFQQDPGLETPIQYKTYDTQLTPEQLQSYGSKFSPQDSQDYDMQGYFKANPNVEPNTPGTHYPDTYKKPNHMTFSDESVYHGQDGNIGGHWGTDAEGKDTFTPGPTNLQQHTPEELKAYFSKVEPDVKLIMPDSAAGMAAKATEKAADALKWGQATPPSLDVDTGIEGPVLFRNPYSSITEKDLKLGMELGLSFSGGGLTFAGVKAARRVGNINELGHAQVLEAEGVHPENVLSQTGWVRGNDNRWKFELDDSKAKFNRDWFDKPANKYPEPKDPFEQVPFDPNQGKTVAKLPEVLDHPELYKAYPALKDVNVVRDPSVRTAHWDEVGNEIVVGSETYNNKQTFLHEVQHAIQTQEGFAKGASWGEAGKSYTLKYAKAAQEQIVEPLKALYDKLTTSGEVVTKAELVELSRLQRMAKKYNEYAKAGDADALERYMNTAGEVEARNVEARMMLNAAERRNMHPTYTADKDAPTLNFKPGVQTPYGFRPYGQAEAPPVPFRRAANDNQSIADWAKEFNKGLPDYGPNEPSARELIEAAIKNAKETED